MQKSLQAVEKAKNWLGTRQGAPYQAGPFSPRPEPVEGRSRRTNVPARWIILRQAQDEILSWQPGLGVASARKSRCKPLKRLKTGSEAAGRRAIRSPPAKRGSLVRGRSGRHRTGEEGIDRLERLRCRERLRQIASQPPGVVLGRCERPEKSPQALENAQNRLGRPAIRSPLGEEGLPARPLRPATAR